jgi:RNA polymerase sigma-70 factor (ECF subfamily)
MTVQLFYIKKHLAEAAKFVANFQALKVELHEKATIRLLQNGDEKTFEQVFKSNYKNLHAYAYTIVKSESLAEEMVQNVFVKIWEKRDRLSEEISLKGYLYRAVHNESLNHLKHEKIKSRYQLHVVSTAETYEQTASRKVLTSELEKKLREALNELPEKCRTIFQLSRFDELKYREIADELKISVKTVESQMGKALKVLRAKLIEFLPLVILTFTNL